MMNTIAIMMLSWGLLVGSGTPHAVPYPMLTLPNLAVQAQPDPIEQQIEDLLVMFKDVSAQTDGDQIMILTLKDGRVKGDIKTVDPNTTSRKLVCSGSARQFVGCAKDYLAQHGCMRVETGTCGEDDCGYACTD